MPRLKIPSPDKWLFSTTLTVRVADLNYGNHIANERVLAYAQEARVRYFKSIDASELNFFGTSMIQGDAAIVYQSEGFLGDLIAIELGVMDVSNSSFDIVCQMYNRTTDKPLAKVKARIVCFDYDNRKVCPVPQAFIELL